MDYLEDEQYYIDRYDLSTIKECLKIVEMFQDIYDKSLSSNELKDMSKEDKYSDTTKIMYWHLWFIQAQEYKNKNGTIKKWMEEDKLKHDKQDYTPVPEDIKCPLCHDSMYFNTSKHLDDPYDSPIMRMMFLFKCTSCNKQQWVYDDGEIRISEPDLCPKCDKELDVKATRKGKVITTFYKCKYCGYSKKDILDLARSDEDHKKWQEEQKKKEEGDKKLLERYRAAFCLSDEDGEKYLFELEAMEYAHQIGDEAKQKYDNSAYEQVSKLKKLTIIELEKLLVETLEKANYMKLTFSSPEIEQFIFAPFTLQDADTSRREKISASTFEKLLKSTLENTNWRLDDKIGYRLGFLSGRLKGYEREDDLLKLYEKKKEPQKPIDPEKRMKYSTSNWVMFAKMRGEQEGIDAVRKRRLEKEPEGFFLDTDGYYNCGICYEGHYGNEIWWNLDGIRCSDCWRNIKKGLIPPLKKNLFDNEDEWISNSQLKSRHNIHPSSVKKLRREGLLHGRDLMRENGSVYKTIYLINENQEFIKKYPRIEKERNSNILTLDMSGHVVQIGKLPDKL
jgi:hypothetical protein